MSLRFDGGRQSQTFDVAEAMGEAGDDLSSSGSYLNSATAIDLTTFQAELNEAMRLTFSRQQESMKALEEMEKKINAVQVAISQNAMMMTSVVNELQAEFRKMKERCDAAEATFLKCYDRTVVLYNPIGTTTENSSLSRKNSSSELEAANQQQTEPFTMRQISQNGSQPANPGLGGSASTAFESQAGNTGIDTMNVNTPADGEKSTLTVACQLPAHMVQWIIYHNLQGSIDQRLQQLGETPLNAMDIVESYNNAFGNDPAFRAATTKYLLKDGKEELLSECLQQPASWDILNDQEKDCYRRLYILMSDASCVSTLRYVATAFLGDRSDQANSASGAGQPISQLLGDMLQNVQCATHTNKFVAIMPKNATATLTTSALEQPVTSTPSFSSSSASRSNTKGVYSHRRYSSKNCNDLSAAQIRKIYEQELAKLNALKASDGGCGAASCCERRGRCESPPVPHRQRCRSMSEQVPMVGEERQTQVVELMKKVKREMDDRLESAACDAPCLNIIDIGHEDGCQMSAAKGGCPTSDDGCPEQFGLPFIRITSDRTVLPPVTDEQFHRYCYVDTAELASKIRRFLRRYSISQRLFGNTVLGLTQGSTSELLSKPKEWHRLTQKGREPYIRMLQVLENEKSFRRLMQLSNGNQAVASNFSDSGNERLNESDRVSSFIGESKNASTPANSQQNRPGRTAQSSRRKQDPVYMLCNDATIQPAPSSSSTAKPRQSIGEQQLEKLRQLRYFRSLNGGRRRQKLPSLLVPYNPRQSRRKRKVNLTAAQLDQLRDSFQKQDQPDDDFISDVASRVALSPKIVQQWFNNHRQHVNNYTSEEKTPTSLSDILEFDFGCAG